MLTFRFDFLFVTLAAGVGAAVFCALAPFLRKRYASRALCVVWLALALWLVCPVHLGLKAAPVQVQVPQRVATQWQQPVALPQGGAAPAQTAPHPAATQPAPQKQALTLRGLALCLWLGGAAALALYKAAAYLWWRRKTLRWNAEPDPATVRLAANAAVQAGVKTLLPVYCNAAAPTAMLVGLWRPLLLVPQNFVQNPQADLILLHEYTHYRRADLPKKLILQAAVCLHWFNPAVWWLNRCAQQEIELACDECVLAVAGNDTAAYGRALLGAAAGRTPCLVSQFGSGKKELKLRLANLFATGKRRGRAVVAAALALACGISLFVACGSSGAGAPPESTPTAAPTEATTPTATPDPAEQMARQAYAFATWFTTSDMNGRYAAFAAAGPTQAEQALAAYYDAAAAFATPTLINEMQNNRFPVVYDGLAVNKGYSTAPKTEDSFTYVSYSTPSDDRIDYKFTVTLTQPDGTTTRDFDVEIKLWFDLSGDAPLIRVFQIKSGWPVEDALLATDAETDAIADGWYEQAADGSWYHVGADGKPDAQSSAAPPATDAAAARTYTTDAATGKLSDVPLLSSLVVSRDYSAASFDLEGQFDMTLEPESYRIANYGLTYIDSGTKLRMQCVARDTDVSPALGLLRADGAVLYLLNGLSTTAGSGAWDTDCAYVPELPPDYYQIVLVNFSDETCAYDFWCSTAVGDEVSSVFVNTASEDGKTRADISVTGNRHNGVITNVSEVVARSIAGLVDPTCAITDATFDPTSKVMTVTCATTGQDTAGSYRQGTAVFKVALPASS